jgi:hypothetical protein
LLNRGHRLLLNEIQRNYNRDRREYLNCDGQMLIECHGLCRFLGRGLFNFENFGGEARFRKLTMVCSFNRALCTVPCSRRTASRALQAADIDRRRLSSMNLPAADGFDEGYYRDNVITKEAKRDVPEFHTAARIVSVVHDDSHVMLGSVALMCVGLPVG